MKKAKPQKVPASAIPEDYELYLRELKIRIRRAQLGATLAVNHELVLLYWRIGCDILERQDRSGWGAKVIDRLAADLRHEFPEMRGFSRTNLLYMRAFAAAWPDRSFVQQVVGRIPWGHNLRILELVKTQPERQWYVHQTIQNGWSRNVLVHQIESALHRRQGKAQTNFSQTLPAPQSELAQQILKDPYNFDFLTLSQHAREKELESGLLDHLQTLLLELGAGFAFVGRQYAIEVDGEDFRIDLLFYHYKLRCFVVVDLKMGPFKPEYAGKMSFYLSAVDDLLRQPDDQQSIGLILCKSKKTIIAEYTLRDSSKPIGVAEYRVTKALPDELKGKLPAIEELEERLARSGHDPGYPPAYAEAEAYPEAYPLPYDPPSE